jgi:hypothetical protein
MDAELAYFHMEVAYLSAIHGLLLCVAEQEKITGHNSGLFAGQPKVQAEEEK